MTKPCLGTEGWRFIEAKGPQAGCLNLSDEQIDQHGDCMARQMSKFAI
jgi:hypothetical protein